MKIFVGYFYQVRFMLPHQVPVSTAMWDPKWYHDNRQQEWVFEDKRGVINGLRFKPFVPKMDQWSDHSGDKTNLCNGKNGFGSCVTNPGQLPMKITEHGLVENCGFLKHYRKQLESLNCHDALKDLENYIMNVGMPCLGDHELEAIVLFHETFDNHCSEREPFVLWLQKNGVPVEKFDHKSNAGR